MGIEPTLSAWKAEVLPLNYTRRQTHANGGGRRIRTFEAEAADLQSAPFNHSGIPPKIAGHCDAFSHNLSTGKLNKKKEAWGCPTFASIK